MAWRGHSELILEMEKINKEIGLVSPTPGLKLRIVLVPNTFLEDIIDNIVEQCKHVRWGLVEKMFLCQSLPNNTYEPKLLIWLYVW